MERRVLRAVIVLCCYFNLASIITADRPSGINERPILTTGLGKIRGSVLESRLGELFYSFRGIRYAKPPVNELRFKPSQPTEQWDDVFDATKDGPMCPQPNDDESDISEDCLRLNVYTRELPPGSRKPVLVYIHPGGYYGVSGQSKNYAGPHYLMDRDIVLVTMNYRLGSLGFLSTGTEDSPGNNGLKDQVIALRWVRNHISKFGGDPNTVTLMGYSAGAMSVTLHMVSPMSKGLFHRAIVMSGAATAQWEIPNDQIEVAKRQARVLNCTDDTAANILRCLQNKTAIELGNSLEDMFEFDGRNPIMLWTPVVEHDFGQERFLTDNPTKLYRLGRFARIPIMAGITKYEFMNPAISVLAKEETRLQMDYNFEQLAPMCFLYERNTDRSKEISKRLRKEYLGGSSITNHSLTGLNNLYGDSVIGFGMHRFIRLVHTSTRVYQYQFSYTGRYSHTYFPGDKPYGAVHHDDLLYLFTTIVAPMFKEGDPEDVIVERMTRLWSNFVIRGDPNRSSDEYLKDLRWRAMTSNRFNYLDIDDDLVIKEQLNTDRYEIWKELFPINSRRREKSEEPDYGLVDENNEGNNGVPEQD